MNIQHFKESTICIQNLTIKEGIIFMKNETFNRNNAHNWSDTIPHVFRETMSKS